MVVTASTEAPAGAEVPVADPAPVPSWWRRGPAVRGRIRPAPRTTAGRRVLTLGVAALGFAAVVALLYNVARRAIVAESDMATLVLEARSVLDGHLMLGGWRMLYDSFWTVEVPFYAIGVLVAGTNSVLLYLVPAVLAALLLAAAVMIARQGRRGGPAIAAVATVVALVGLPSNTWAVLLLHAGWHVGTMLWCLIAFAALRSGRWGVGWWVAVLFLTAGMLGDLQTLALGLGPVALAGMVASARTRRWLAGAPALTAALAGFAGWWVIHTAATAWGGYQTGNINLHATPDQMHANVRNLSDWMPQIFGTGTGSWGNTGVPEALGLVRYAALAAVAVAVVLALASILMGLVTGNPGRPGTDQSWRIDDVLVLACLADLAFYVYAAQTSDPAYQRYLSPFVVFGAVLAGRTAGRVAQRLRPGALRRGLAIAGVTVMAVFGTSLAITSTQPAPPITGADLSAFLADHGLTNGLGTYWPASMTTVASGGTIAVRPVIAYNGKVVRYDRQATSDWYAGQQFQFLVFDTANPWGDVDETSATATFGPFANSYRFGSYEVLTWTTPITVSPEVG
jgi:hypothetical protein